MGFGPTNTGFKDRGLNRLATPLNGAGGRFRTAAPRVTKPLLYQLSYTSVCAISKPSPNRHRLLPTVSLARTLAYSKRKRPSVKWSGQRASNPQHPAWRAGALPVELWPHMPGLPGLMLFFVDYFQTVCHSSVMFDLASTGVFPALAEVGGMAQAHVF